MKVKSQPKHRIMAKVLLSTYALFWLSWSLHYLIAPEHHHPAKVCRYAPNQKYLHSEEYAAADCSICQLAPTLAKLPDPQIPALSLPEPVSANNNSGETIFLPVSLTTLSQPRAPPAPLS